MTTYVDVQVPYFGLEGLRMSDSVILTQLDRIVQVILKGIHSISGQVLFICMVNSSAKSSGQRRIRWTHIRRHSGEP